MRVYITKYAMTKGIIVRDDAVLVEGGMIKIPGQFSAYYHKPDWHTSARDAVVQAEKMLRARIASLERSLEKAGKTKFTFPDEVLEPVYPGPELRPQDVVFLEDGRAARVLAFREDGVLTSEGLSCASTLRREKKEG